MLQSEVIMLFDKINGKVKTYEKNDLIFNEGDKCNYVCIVTNGAVKISTTSSLYNEFIISTIKSGESFGENLNEKLEEHIERLTEYFFNNRINCGGYALQLPIKIYNAFNYSFEERVLRILELYPFVRLLGDTQLKEEEYIVLYRAEDTGFGHHFVKIYNNKASQKNSDGVPMNFTEWGEDWENEQEAVFAVLPVHFSCIYGSRTDHRRRRGLFRPCESHDLLRKAGHRRAGR